MKEAEFLRAEALICIEHVRRLALYATSIAGFTLPVLAALLEIEDGAAVMLSMGDVLEALNEEYLIIQFICLGVALSCLAFLRIYVGSFTQICNFARYFREYLVPAINAQLGSPEKEVFHWENWLGYSRRINPETGTIDFYTDGTRKKEDGKGNQWESEELAIARSMRRPGYRAARKNYLKVIDAVPKGGTAQDRDRVKRLGRRIVAECPLSDLHWTFEVIATPIPNALCTGEGFVMVTTGLLDLNLSDDELAGVLGHEVAHGVRRHTLLYEERFDELMALNKQMQSLESQLGQAEAEGDAHSAHRIKARGRALLPRIQFLVDFLKNKQSYDLHEEEEADVLGITYAAAAGFDPDGEARALTKLQRRSVELFGQSINKSSRTHPPLKRRLEILRLVQSRWRS